VLTTLEELNSEQLVKILTEPKNALIKQYKKLMEYDGVELEFQDEALKAIADQALERGIGARGLRAVVEATMNPLMYAVPSDKTITKIIITPEAVGGAGEPILERGTKKR
jgi:ATP-dependent Clp protease ATP-binding subunit ClpX